MLKRLNHILSAIALLFLAGLALLVAPTFFDPQFEIRNASDGPVSVVAEWRDTERAFPAIPPGLTVSFSVKDEAGMAFRVRYPDGREVVTEPIYFSRGLTIITTITEEGAEVRHDHDV